MDRGKNISRYRILDRIAEGGMGEVYRGNDTKLHREIAIKVLPADVASSPERLLRFEREATTVAALNHPNIVTIFEFGEVAGSFYLVMEFVDGVNLREMLRDGKLPPEQAMAIVPQICDALHYAHGEGVVHRDIKPENLLLDKKGRVKIADFGLAKLIGPDRVDVTLTAPQQVMGTLHYMAPEQMEKPLTVDHRADIYSLGVVFYEMLPGELPIGRFAPPSQKVQVDVRLDEVVLKTLEKEPDRRYQHVSDVKTAVERITTGDSATEAAKAEPTPTPTRIMRLPFALSASEIVLCCAYLHSQSPDGHWLDRALRIAHFHWDQRDKTTNLFVNVPDSSPKGRFDNRHADTTISGAWASRIFMAGRLTGNQELIDMARNTLLAWAKYGWDAESQKPWASLSPEGTPHDGKRNYAGISYGKFDPVGHWDLWKDYVLGFESPLNTLLVYALAADALDDPQLKTHAVRLADYVRRNLPANGKYGTMAENYGKVISFYLQMEQLTGEIEYRETAEQVAKEALDHLWTGKLLRGFSGRTHYSAQEGSGYLVQALIELDADPKKLNGLRERNVFWWNF